jgi:hypothetical protein
MVTRNEIDYIRGMKNKISQDTMEKYHSRNEIWPRVISDRMSMSSNTLAFLELPEFNEIRKLGHEIVPIFIGKLVESTPYV